MDNVEHDVIYFSFGSVFISSSTPVSVIKMFGSLKQTVVWKYDGPDLDGWMEVPKNIFVVKWAPQTSILSN